MKIRALFCAALCATSLFAVGCGNDNNDDDTFVNAAAIQNAQANLNATGQTVNGSTFNLSLTGTTNANTGGFVISDQTDSVSGNILSRNGNNVPTSIRVILTDTSAVGGGGLVRSFDFNVKDQNGLMSGEVLNFSIDNNVNPGVNAIYQEQGTANGSWVSTSGTMTINNISSTQMSVTLNNVVFSPVVQGGNSASGDFVVNGTSTIVLQ